MVGFAISIVSFIIVALFLYYLAIGALALFGGIFSSSNPSNNKARGLLQPILKILDVGEGKTISSETSKDTLKEAIKLYYELLEEIFESETPEQRKNIFSSNTPSGKFSSAFFALTGLSKSLNTLTWNINHVIEGSGWIEYKKLLEDSTAGTLKKVGNKKYEIIFSKDFYLTVEEHYTEYKSSYDKDEWSIHGYYNKKEVLSCYTPRSNDVVYTFKPGVWILYILKSAERYSGLIDDLELKTATERRRADLFD